MVRLTSDETPPKKIITPMPSALRWCSLRHCRLRPVRLESTGLLHSRGVISGHRCPYGSKIKTFDRFQLLRVFSSVPKQINAVLLLLPKYEKSKKKCSPYESNHCFFRQCKAIAQVDVIICVPKITS